MTGLSSWLAQQTLRSFSPADRDAAWRTVFDTLAVAIGAHQHEGAAIAAIAAQLCEGGPRGIVRVPGSTEPLPPAHAAAILALAAHSIDYDDTYMEGGVKTHISAIVVPAAFAVAQAVDASADELLDAVCAGVEVEARLGHVVTPGMVKRWHPTGTLGPVGAAAAAARLLQLDAGRTEQALGMAADAAAGTRVCLEQGDATKSLHAANAARNGVEAAFLVSRGAMGPIGFMEHPRGYLQTYVGHLSDWQSATGPAAPRVHGNSVKLYPAMHALHAAVAGLIGLRRHRADEPSAIVVTQSTSHAAFGASRDPQTSLAARLSLAYCAAVSWLDGACGFAQFETARLRDPALRRLMERVSVVASEELERDYPHRIASRVEVRFADGTRSSTFVADPPGCPARPASTTQLRAKWGELLRAFAPEARQAWLNEFEASRTPSARALAALVPAPAQVLETSQ